MKIKEVFEKKKTVLSFEIFPPKHDTTLSDIDETLAILSELKPDYISVTFGAGGSLNNNKTIELAKKIKHEYGIEPLVHLTCLCYSKSDIDNYVSLLNENGLENVLALRGDRNPAVPEKDDFIHASELVSYVKNNSNLCVAGACYPECHPESKDRADDIGNLKKKVEAGADFLISQLFFDNVNYFSFLEICRIAGIGVPIMPGIMPAINKAQIERMTGLCGATLPGRFIKILNRYSDNKQALFDAGMSYAVSQIIDLLASGVEGIHIYTMNNPTVAKRICGEIKNLI